jgi:hypothetical protein
MHIVLIALAAIVALRVLWALVSWIEEALLGISNSIIETLTPTGISLILSAVIFYFSIKYIKLIVQLIGSFFTDIPSKQKKIATPLFAVLIVTIVLIKGITVNSYAKNVKDFYNQSNSFVEKTSVFTKYKKKSVDKDSLEYKLGQFGIKN